MVGDHLCMSAQTCPPFPLAHWEEALVNYAASTPTRISARERMHWQPRHLDGCSELEVWCVGRHSARHGHGVLSGTRTGLGAHGGSWKTTAQVGIHRTINKPTAYFPIAT
jgi:hypothetical protein